MSQVNFSLGRIQDFLMCMLIDQHYKCMTAEGCIGTSGVQGILPREILKSLEEASSHECRNPCLV